MRKQWAKQPVLWPDEETRNVSVRGEGAEEQEARGGVRIGQRQRARIPALHCGVVIVVRTARPAPPRHIWAGQRSGGTACVAQHQGGISGSGSNKT